MSMRMGRNPGKIGEIAHAAAHRLTPARFSAIMEKSRPDAVISYSARIFRMKTFRNPVSPFDAPDPFMTYDPVTGYYYSLFTRGRVLELFRSRHAAEICTNGDSRVIYRADGPRDGVWGDIWAPEMHRGSNGKWYIYTSGRMQEAPGEKRLFIMEAFGDDPFGEWRFKGKPSPDGRDRKSVVVGKECTSWCRSRWSPYH